MLNYLMKASNSALRFLESDYIIPDPNASTKGTDVEDVYKKWCMERGITPMSRDKLYSIVGTKYYKYEREGTIWFKGFRLNPNKVNQKPDEKTLFDF